VFISLCQLEFFVCSSVCRPWILYFYRRWCRPYDHRIIFFLFCAMTITVLRCGYTAGKQTRRSAECESGTPMRFLAIAVRRPVNWQISRHIDRVALRHFNMSLRRKRMLCSAVFCSFINSFVCKKRHQHWTLFSWRP
jgi:hypothetical protein